MDLKPVCLITPKVMRKVLVLMLMTLHLFCAAQIIRREYPSNFSASTALRMNSIFSGSDTRGINGVGINILAYVRFASGVDIDALCDKYGVRLNVGHDGVYTAVIPYSSIYGFAGEDGVLAVDAGKEVHEMMDSVRIASHVDDVYSGAGLSMPYRGKGVLVGIIDSGFDYTHPNFKDEEGNCRIRCVWEQNKTSSSATPSYGYGSVYSGADVVSARHDASGDTHGTHVAGIAAGSYGGVYRGVAPEASIVLVSTNKTEQGIIDGLDFLLKYADECNMPLSVNLSLGTVLGYKDGTDNFSILSDALMEGKQGCLLSVAVGNEGNRNSTLYGVFGEGGGEIRSYLTPPYYGRDNIFVQGTSGHDYSMTISLEDTVAKKEIFSKTFTSSDVLCESYEGFGSMDGNDAMLTVSVEKNAVSGNPAFDVMLSYSKQDNEAWKIVLSADGGTLMANCDYGYFSSAGQSGYSDGTSYCSMAATAAGKNIISVGAYVTKSGFVNLNGTRRELGWKKDDAYPLSGKGPSFDGRVKPDVSAPGAAVVSSYNSYAAYYSISEADKAFEVSDKTGRTYSWGVESGTSMATPVVAGALALWLEAGPSLTVDDVRGVIERTAEGDEFTGELPNGTFGMGKLNVAAGLKDVLGMTSSIRNIGQNREIFYDKYSGKLTVVSDENIRKVYVYSVSGGLEDVLTGSDNVFRLGNYKKGIYIVKANTFSHVISFKIVI